MDKPIVNAWKEEWKVSIRDRDFAGNAVLMIYRKNLLDNSIEYITQKLTIEKTPQGEMMPVENMLLIPHEILQAASDELGEKGFLPRGRRYKEEQELLTDHLADMRKVAFKFLGEKDA